MELDALNCTIFKPHGRNAFEFAPASGTEDLAQTSYLAYAGADGDGFDLFDLANDLKIFAGWWFRWSLEQY